MDGIEIINQANYSLYYISAFSEEIKTAIRNRLSSICHGVADAATGRQLYSYRSTLKEFLKRYNDKTDAQKKGMIGELLLHIIITEVLNEFTIDSPFFNTEERNVKKGFDVVLSKTGSTELWLAEVKSGNIHANKDVSQTAVELINTAQNDLNNRLNGDSVSLWLNAVNGAKAAIDEARTDRDAIISILQDCGDEAVQDNLHSKDFNVVLVGTLFNPLDDRIDETKISSKYSKVVNKHYFNKVYLVAIQKEDYQLVVDFLEREGNA